MKARVEFLDNLRFALIISVVAVHGALAYSHMVPYWPIDDVGVSIGYDLFVFFRDLFGMPLLFLISGYFAWMSLSRSSAHPWRFLWAKYRRLGLPFMVALLFLAPAVTYMYRYKGDAAALTVAAHFSEHWLLFLQSVASLSTRILGDEAVSDVVLGHLWYISALLVFYTVMVLVFVLFAGRSAPWVYRLVTQPLSRAILVWLVALPAAVGAGLNAYALLFHAGLAEPVWVVVWSVFSIQLVRIGTYAGAFIFGMWLHANHVRVFDAGEMFRLPLSRWWVIAAAGFVVALAGYGLQGLAHDRSTGLGILMVAVYSLGRAVLTAALMMICLRLTRAWWNRSGGLARRLSAASFDIYLLHMPFVVWMQFALWHSSLPDSLKFVLVVVGSVLACLCLSELLMQRHRVLQWLCLAMPAGVMWAIFG